VIVTRYEPRACSPSIAELCAPTKPYTMKYLYLTTMVLNEMQKQYHSAESEAEVIKSQEQRISELEEGLSRAGRGRRDITGDLQKQDSSKSESSSLTISHH